ncbi:MAG: DUF4339 domain-containing protein [Rhodopirellula sp.]|nr:DUF4339 domain-containing protein [Rhodopirellula sp.]
MPIVVACKACGGKFNAPDHLGGKRVKCPKCAAAVAIPAAGQAAATKRQVPAAKETASAGGEWFAEASDGAKYGPLSIRELRELVAAGKLDEFSRVRKQGSDAWQWLEDAFASPRDGSRQKPAAEPANASDLAAGERLTPCPDCGAMISRRARQCPQCGCPIPVAAPGVSAAGAGDIPTSLAPKRKGPVVAAGIVVALVVISIPAFIFAQYWINSRKQPAAPPPVATATPPAPAVTEEQKRQWMDEVVAVTARDLDDLCRRVYAATAIMDRAQESIKLIETLSQPGAFADAVTDAAAAKPVEAKPYESQYDALAKECLAHLQANLPQGDFDRAKLEEVAGNWAAAKRAPLEKKLQEQVEQQIFVR